jgi:imidazolonepropionase
VIIYKNISHLFTLLPMKERSLKNAATLEDCGYIPDASVWVDDSGTISWLGPSSALKPLPPHAQVIACQGETWIPGLIDGHTHMVFGGQRSLEMMQKRSGVSYLNIAKQGGGILSTVQMTRETSRDELFDLACQRVETSIRQGIKHLEIKSGYGLSFKTELMLLKIIRDLKLQFEDRVGISTTCLAAHAFPKDVSSDTYLKMVTEELIPEVASLRLAEFCDVFVEQNFFSVSQARNVLEAARHNGLKLKAHVDECTSLGGIGLAVELGAVSVDHCIAIQPSDVKVLANSNTTAVLLPMTSFVLQEGYAPAKNMIESGVRVALASDFNPGSSPSQNLWLAAQIGMIQYGLSPYQVLSALTYNAACSLAKEQKLGMIEVGMPAQQVTRLAYGDWQEMFYWIGQPIPVVEGKI